MIESAAPVPGAPAVPRSGQVKTAVIVQSNYIPWKGYFDLINLADDCILLDDVQYTRRDWRNRNLIKTREGTHWLTIPVEVKGRYHQKIKDTRISKPDWGVEHWATIRHNYAQARHFREYSEIFEPLYLTMQEEYLSRVNFLFIKAICALLGIGTRISWSMDYALREGKNERLIGLCESVGARHYLSGPSAKGYIDEAAFAQSDITVSFMDYAGYPPYTQLGGAFDHHVSILDLIFNEGPDARKFMRSFGSASAGRNEAA